MRPRPYPSDSDSESVGYANMACERPRPHWVRRILPDRPRWRRRLNGAVSVEVPYGRPQPRWVRRILLGRLRWRKRRRGSAGESERTKCKHDGEYNVLVKSPVEATRGSVLLIIGNSPSRPSETIR
jgi:hypothetical protein